MTAIAGSAVLAAAVWAAPAHLPGPPQFITLPPDATVNTTGSGTVPTWTGSFEYRGKMFTFAMVGTNPALGSATTTVPVEVVPVIFKFSNGVSLDPTANSCGDTASAVGRVMNSPVFQTANYTPGGTNVGTTQYEDAFQRANFWNFVSTSALNYHVLLASTLEPAVTINVPALLGQAVAGPCSGSGTVNNGDIGLVAVNAFQFVLKNLLAPKYPSNTLPIFLFYNTFFYQGNPNNCCILGFHTAFGTAPNQLTVAVAAFSDAGIFDVPIEDIHALTHEIGEWMDDPFVNNAVPGWKGGQVGACSFVLEVGDPVTGIASDVTMNGFTYHPEDLVFLPWFEKASAPTTSVNGWYTFLNSFSAPKFCF
ncbi:MAG TPA: hypothetical protein VH640_11825 [Bryobacteraceae bacterium]